MEEILKALRENKELGAKLKKLWQEKASAADIQALLKEEGYDVDVSVVEEALQRSQNDLGKKVAMEKLDDETLATVAGGGSGLNCSTTDDCDSAFKECTYGYENKKCNGQERCTYDDYCDQNFECYGTWV